MCAVLNEAVEDYVGKTPASVKKVMPAYLFNKSTIIKDLKDQRMVALTDGMSITVADNLKTNAKQIAKNIEKLSKEYAIVKVDTYDSPKFQ
jgi:Mg-chelatase subunit ChlD